MPPKRPYKFTRPQHEYLKSHLELYMVALQAEDTVKEITSVINTVYDALVKEFNLGSHGQDEKDAIQMVSHLRKYRYTGKNIYCWVITTVAHHVV